MTESARPESIVPAPPQVFRQWVKRQALIAVGITVCVIGFFVVRMLMRSPSPLRDFDGRRVWVAGAPAQGAYGTPAAVALEPGGAHLDVRAVVQPTAVRWNQNGAVPTMWPCVALSVDDSRRLVRESSVSIGLFAILGEKRVVDGVEWQEAWWWTNDGSGPMWRAQRSGVVTGDWRIAGASETPALLRLDDTGVACVVPDGESESAEAWAGAWVADDGVIRIMEDPRSSQRRKAFNDTYLIGRLAPDGRSFTGFETSGAAVTGTRVE